MVDKYKEISRLFFALCKPQRVIIFELLLKHKQLTVQSIVEMTDIVQSSVSKHLRFMVDQGLVSEERVNHHIKYFYLTDHPMCKYAISVLDTYQ